MKINVSPNILQTFAGWLVSNVEAILLMCTPLLSALPSMFAAIRALEKGGWAQAGLIGGIVEALGLASGAFIGYVESHNLRHPEQAVSRFWGYAVFVFYLVVVESLIISHTPDAVSVLLPGLTVIGSVIVGFRRLMFRSDEQKKLETERQNAKDNVEAQRVDARFQLDMELKRREAEQKLAQQAADHAQKLELQRLKTVNKGVNTGVNIYTAPSEPTQDDTVNGGEVDAEKLLEYYRQNEKASLRKAGAEFGVSHTQVSKILKRLESEGRVSVNGVVKVL